MRKMKSLELTLSQIDPAVPDAMTHILRAKDKGVKLTDRDLVGDAMLFLVRPNFMPGWSELTSPPACW